MRSATCPVCNSHAQDLAGRAAALRAANVRVLVAVAEGGAEVAAWQAKRELPFRVVTGQPGSLLIDRVGVIGHARAATMPTNGYDKKGITRAIDDLLPRPSRLKGGVDENGIRGGETSGTAEHAGPS